jgi:DNA-binding transcriptional MerR regulator
MRSGGQHLALPHKSSEVSDMFDIEPRTLFVYESENLIAPERTPTQRRRYSRRDIERIRLIRELTTVHGINLAGVKVIFSLMEAAVQSRLQIPESEFPELAGARHLWA